MVHQQHQHRDMVKIMPQVNSSAHYMKHVSIAPAASEYKRYASYPNGNFPSTINNPSVIRRNARERNRVKQVNNGFVSLRQHIPSAIIADLSNGKRGGSGPSSSKKLSKVDTLRMALEYIRRLKNVIDEVDSSDTSSTSSFNSESSSTSGSPPPTMTLLSPQQFPEGSYNTSYFTSTNFYHNQQDFLVPSSTSPANIFYNSSSNEHNSRDQMKSGNALDEFDCTDSTEEEEMLDYISLWQGDL